MNGAETLVHTLADAGVDVCFANPGTTEMELVSALDRHGGIRSVLALFEGVCTAAADGYARMAGRTAATLLHLGPGFANGIANLHNAHKAQSPIMNVVGDHATYHRVYDAPLQSDVETLAGPMSDWVRSSGSAQRVAPDAADALAAACGDGGHIATLIVPSDCQWNAADGPARAGVEVTRSGAPQERVEEVAKLAASGESGVLLLGGTALGERGLRAAQRICAATGWRLASETWPARMERGAGVPAPERLPYFPEQALDALDGATHLVLAGTASPVAFFAYPGLPSSVVPLNTTTHVLAEPRQDAADALECLADLVNGPAENAPAAAARPQAPTGPLTPESAGAALAALQPEGAIIVDEAITAGLAYFSQGAAAPPHTYIALTGGAIGWGLPAATGAAIACPDRPVIAYQADGSAMYTVQALWTQARESLDVTTLLVSNRSYKILQVELERAGVTDPGPQATALTDLGQPALDWVALANAMGVPASRAASAEEVSEQLARSLAEPGPHLVEMVL